MKSENRAKTQKIPGGGGRLAVPLVASLLASWGAFASVTPTVDNVTFTQDPFSRLVTITYDLDASAVVTLDVTTNGVSIGGANIQGLLGDVNRKIVVEDGAATTHAITWRPDVSWAGGKLSNAEYGFKAVVKAWALDAPPPYMVVDLAVPNSVAYYPSADAVPFGVTNDLYKTTSLVLRRIPAAGVTWRMGSPESEKGRMTDGRETAHLVAFTEDYYIGIYEMTQAQQAIFWHNGNMDIYDEYFKGETKPTCRIPYGEIRGYGSHGINWPETGHAVRENATTHRSCALESLRHLTGVDFDLPTEAQWEYACRAGTGSTLYNGRTRTANSDETGVLDLSWNADNATVEEAGATRPHEVGLKEPNAWGLYDMYGNVQEFCLDAYDVDCGLSDLSQTAVDPEGATSDADYPGRVLRGGCYSSAWLSTCRSAYRLGTPANSYAAANGWRVWAPCEAK